MQIVSGDIPESGYNGISDKFHKLNYTSESCTPWQVVRGFDLPYISYLDDRVTPEICKDYAELILSITCIANLGNTK